MKGLDKETLAAAHAQMARGQALATIGTGIAVAGAAGLAFFANATQAAMEFNAEAALTKTQTDKIKVSIEQLKTMAKTTAAAIPVPLAELQSMLYDIFSSMDVNVPQAQKLLDAFAHAAVAGNTDIQTAGRGTIAVLNAYHLPASRVNKINDIMFQLVRKGVGTYDEFAKSIGRAIPSAARAGQNFQQLAGMMAFLTRNGLSTSMAASSAARALDALSNPTSVKRMEAMGISVKDASGEFRPMTDIIEQLSKKLSGLTAPQRAKALQNLFKGSGGTIQARRFLDLAVANFGELNQRVKEMNNSKGAMSDAYNVMFKQPQNQIKLLTNQYAILKTEMGDALIPVVMDLVGALTTVTHWFNGLSPTTRKYITITLAAVSAIAVLAGLVTAIAGLWLMFSAAVALAGASLTGVLVTIGIVVGAIIAIGVALFFIIKYHKQIWAFMVKTWNQIWAFLVDLWSKIWGVIGPYVMAVVNGIVAAWNAIYAFVATWVPKIWNFIVTAFTTYVAIVSTIISTLWHIWQAIWGEIWFWIGPIVKGIWALISTYFQAMYAVISLYVKLWWIIISTIVKLIWGIIKTVFTAIWKFLGPILSIIGSLIRITFQIAYSIVKTNVQAMWSIAKWAWSLISSFTRTTWNLVKTYIITPLASAYSGAKTHYMNITNGIKNAFNTVKGWIQNAWSVVTGFIINPIADAADALTGFFGDIEAKVKAFVDKITGPLKAARDLLKSLNPLQRFSPSIVDQAKLGWAAMHRVTDRGLRRVLSTTRRHAKDIRSAMTITGEPGGPGGLRAPGLVGPGGAAPAPSSYGVGNNVSVQQTIYTNEIDPVKNAADLGWAVARRMA